MEALRQTFHQYASLFRGMSPSQRGTMIAVPLMVGGALAFLAFGDRSSSLVAVSWGKVFTTDELNAAEQTLLDAGLRDFRREGQRLLVPRHEVERYNAALLEGGSLPSNWYEERARQLEKQGLFTSDRQSREMMDVALARELSRMIRALPDVEDASVVWARSRAGRWPNQQQKVTATVSVRPRRGREMSMPLVHSLRAAVANMVPDLQSADVVVLDQSRGKAYHPDNESDPFDSGLLSRIREFEQGYQGRIADALSYIPGVLVAAHVEVDSLRYGAERTGMFDPKPTVTTGQTRNAESGRQTGPGEPGVRHNEPRSLSTSAGPLQTRRVSDSSQEHVTVPPETVSDKQSFAAMPRAVQVAVKIPEDYYRAVALKRGLTEGRSDAEREAFRQAVDEIRRQEETQARATAMKLIPPDSPETAVEVGSFVPLDPSEPEVNVPLSHRVGDSARQWVSALGLVLFAFWALWMLKKSMPRLPELPPESAVPLAGLPPGDEEPEEEEAPPKITRCDSLQSLVRDNPEMTAAVLSKWIQAAK